MRWAFFLFFIPSVSFAATEGPKFPGTGSNDAFLGTTAWANPENITAQDTAYSSNTLTTGLIISEYIVGSNFSFTCPSSALVTGIQIHAEKTQPFPDTSGTRTDDSIILVIGGSTSTDKSTGAGWNTVKDYGGVSDTWGLSNLTCGSLSTMQFKAAGVASADTIGVSTIGMSYVTATVTYTISSPLQAISDFEDLF